MCVARFWRTLHTYITLHNISQTDLSSLQYISFAKITLPYLLFAAKLLEA